MKPNIPRGTRIQCVIIDMPPHVGGVTVQNSEKNYDIYLNANLPIEKITATFQHELMHIGCNHFSSTQSIYSIEQDADRPGT